MTPPILLRGGATLYWVDPDRGVVTSAPLAGDPDSAAALAADGVTGAPLSRRREWARKLPGSRLADGSWAEALRSADGPLPLAEPDEIRAARSFLPTPPRRSEREFALAVARHAAARALAGPDETLIALAREEARLERAEGREIGAVAQWVTPPSGPLSEHAESQRRFVEVFRRHHTELEHRLAELATARLPNLSRLVGPKVAARLLAAAGGRAQLARCTGARIQLLGARRRPVGGRGPRFGVLYRAPGIAELPPDRQGRFARSLAALAAIAVRGDALTGGDLGDRLERRRDRRLATLRRGTR